MYMFTLTAVPLGIVGGKFGGSCPTLASCGEYVFSFGHLHHHCIWPHVVPTIWSPARQNSPTRRTVAHLEDPLVTVVPYLFMGIQRCCTSLCIDVDVWDPASQGMMFDSLVMPTLSYASEVWAAAPKTSCSAGAKSYTCNFWHNW